MPTSAGLVPPRAGISRSERVSGLAIRDMVCSLFFEIEPCLEMDYIYGFTMGSY
jgi:hypothetical protein